MKNEDKHKTAFKTHSDHIEFNVMSFGLTFDLVTFQSLMNNVFKPVLRRFVLVFFDDTLIYSITLDEHIQHVRKVLELLRENKFKENMNKYELDTTQIEYLGHIISKKGVVTDPKKIKTMVQWSKSKSVRELRGFLGLIGYYRKIC
jgi:Reverse transcriptase (RNA-dependent DNA polymerase)